MNVALVMHQLQLHLPRKYVDTDPLHHQILRIHSNTL